MTPRLRDNPDDLAAAFGTAQALGFAQMPSLDEVVATVQQSSALL